MPAYFLPRGNRVRTGKSVEEIVDRSVLLNDHDDMPDRSGRKWRRRRYRLRDGGDAGCTIAGKRAPSSQNDRARKKKQAKSMNHQ
jgi:hypothetical protein